MARLVFGMNVSLDGFVDHMAFAPDPALFAHFIAEAEAQSGSLYGSTIYEVMRYWDDDQPGWQGPERAFAAAWRRQPKWVASRQKGTVGPNATRIGKDLEAEVRAIKSAEEGEIEVAGPTLAHALSRLGLIDEYRLYLHPVVLGQGSPYFAGPRPRLRLSRCDRMSGDVMRLCYVPQSADAVT